MLTQTPSAIAMAPAAGRNRTALVMGGEACPADVVDSMAPGRVMINAYGPTETTIYVVVSAPLSAGGGAAPIGSPVPGSALFVLDGWLQPVPGRRRSASCTWQATGWVSGVLRAGPG